MSDLAHKQFSPSLASKWTTIPMKTYSGPEHSTINFDDNTRAKGISEALAKQSPKPPMGRSLKFRRDVADDYRGPKRRK